MVSGFAKVNTVPYGALMTRADRLTKDAWIAAGFRMLASDGPASLKAEVLARQLGTTKGSFYWHFADLPAFKAALLAAWQDKAAQAAITEVGKIPNPRDRLKALAATAKAAAPAHFGGRQVEPAIRAWALSSPKVMTALLAIDTQRIAFVTTILKDMGISDPTYARMFYAAFLGADDLASKHGDAMTDALDAAVTLILQHADQDTT